MKPSHLTFGRGMVFVHFCQEDYRGNTQGEGIYFRCPCEHHTHPIVLYGSVVLMVEHLITPKELSNYDFVTLLNFHQLGPLGRVGLVVLMSVHTYVFNLN